ncbi:hypothetical protein HZH66_014994 [Vespula vulgaris]|uniref:Uncharacterized protein n=1 Tax=Vespula vulgaris TaxID=7454 RepID=A0A834IYB2_VESVU|nr:hypothetical protein HZH66_014994 [Vespula vulgaris]
MSDVDVDDVIKLLVTGLARTQTNSKRLPAQLGTSTMTGVYNANELPLFLRGCWCWCWCEIGRQGDEGWNDEGHDKILGVFANNFSDMSSESEDIDHCKDDIESERSEVDCSDVVKALTVVMI